MSFSDGSEILKLRQVKFDFFKVSAQKTHSCELTLSCGLITLASGLIAKTSDPCYAKVSGLPILRAFTTVILGLA